jgi:hypothetical protein
LFKVKISLLGHVSNEQGRAKIGTEHDIVHVDLYSYSVALHLALSTSSSITSLIKNLLSCLHNDVEIHVTFT